MFRVKTCPHCGQSVGIEYAHVPEATQEILGQLTLDAQREAAPEVAETQFRDSVWRREDFSRNLPHNGSWNGA